MANDGLVSVIVPTYNRAYCLEKAVDSALAQSHGNVEVVLIDDGSTDGTQALVEHRYGGDSRVRYFRQPNGGISRARNVGLARAQGAFIAFLDSDDEWEPWKLELQVACLRGHPELGMTWTDMVAIDPTGEVISKSYLRRMYSAYRWFPTPEALFRGSDRLDRTASSRDMFRPTLLFRGDRRRNAHGQPSSHVHRSSYASSGTGGRRFSGGSALCGRRLRVPLANLPARACRVSGRGLRPIPTGPTRSGHGSGQFNPHGDEFSAGRRAHLDVEEQTQSTSAAHAEGSAG